MQCTQAFEAMAGKGRRVVVVRGGEVVARKADKGRKKAVKEADSRDLSAVPPQLRQHCIKPGQVLNPNGRPAGLAAKREEMAVMFMDLLQKQNNGTGMTYGETLMKKIIADPQLTQHFMDKFLETLTPTQVQNIFNNNNQFEALLLNAKQQPDQVQDTPTKLLDADAKVKDSEKP